MNYQDKVATFMRISGQLVATEPRELTKEEFEFRDNLLREEIRELKDAVVDDNRVEILDALCDIKYVNDGTANMIGYKQYDDAYFNVYGGFIWYTKEFYLDSILSFEDDDLKEFVDDINHSVITLANLFGFTLENFKNALDRVHESNMSKFCYDVKTAERTQEFYKKQGINTYVEPRQKQFVVYREGDGKVLKSVEYYPVQLSDLV